MAPPVTSAANQTVWDRLGTPLRALAWVLLVAGVLAVYREAADFVGHVFSVVLLFVFAAVVAVVLTPVVDLAQRLRPFRAHRGPAALLLYALVMAVLVGIGFLVAPTLFRQGKQLPELGTHLQAQLNQWGIPLNLDAVFTSLKGFSLTSGLGLVTGVVGSIVSVVLVIVISIYLLIEGRAVMATLRKLFPSHTQLFDFVALAAGSTAEAYVRGQVLMSLIIGAYITVAMELLGVHYAILLGVAAAILELVPMVGAVIAMALAVIVALLQSPGLGIATLGVGLLGHALEAYVVGPRISGRVTRLHPLVAMAALLVGAEVAGVLGALFGVPIAAIANIVLGAAYRSRQGAEPLTTSDKGEIEAETLPRLGDEIGGIDDEGVVSEPVPRKKDTSPAPSRPRARRSPGATR